MNTGVGTTVVESARSASPVTSTSTDVVVALFDAFESVVCDVTSAQFKIVVPAAVPAPIFTTYVNAPLVVPLATFALAVQITEPVPPAAGVVPQAQPVGAVIELNVVFGGVC